METQTNYEQLGGTGPVHKSGGYSSGKPSKRLRTAIVIAIIAAGLYVVYDLVRLHNTQRVMTTQMANLSEQIDRLNVHLEAGEAATADLMARFSESQKDAGQTKQQLSRMDKQIAQETQRAKYDLNHAIAAKADASAVEAVKQEADTKIGQVSTDVGGVKSDVGEVKTNLANTRSDLASTQRRLNDVNDILSSAVAKNSTELAELRRKGERNYVEFTIPKRNAWQKVEDISVELSKTDPKNKKFNIMISVDDSKLEKKDRTINEPVQFLVGKNHVRYELVINWVQKDRVGGYLSVPKDKVLAAELQQQK